MNEVSRKAQDENMGVPLVEFEAIAKQIGSEVSPVGIDARKTHVIIIHMLQEIHSRLSLIEERLARLEEEV